MAIKVCNKQLVHAGRNRTGNPVADTLVAEFKAKQAFDVAKPLFPICDNVQQVVEEGAQHCVLPYDLMEDDKSYYSIAPLVNGVDMITFLDPKRSSRTVFTEAQAKPIFRKLARGLAYLHSRGIAHRDVSLENIMLSEAKDSQDFDSLGVHIVDFGAAVVLSEPTNDGKFPCAQIKDVRPGKPSYMSPEVWQNTEDGYDAFACDLYAFGILLYCVLTGRFPYAEMNDGFARNLFSLRWLKHFEQCNCSCHRNNTMCSYHSCVHHQSHSHLSSKVVDLLSHLICLESRRFNIFQVLSHAWFQ